MKKNQNKCPKCGNEDIVWGRQELFDDWGLYPALCNACGFEGNQCFDISFQVWQDVDGNELNEWKEV